MLFVKASNSRRKEQIPKATNSFRKNANININVSMCATSASVLDSVDKLGFLFLRAIQPHTSLPTSSTNRLVANVCGLIQFERDKNCCLALVCVRMLCVCAVLLD